MRPPRVDEWLRALKAAPLPEAHGGPEGFSVRELSDMLGLCDRAIAERLRRWIAAGEVEFAGLRPGVSLDGRKTRGTPVYRVVRPTTNGGRTTPRRGQRKGGGDGFACGGRAGG